MTTDDVRSGVSRPPLASHMRLGWFGFSHVLAPETAGPDVRMRHVAHSLLYVLEGDARATCLYRGREFAADGDAGMVRFNPADGEEHTLFGTAGRRGMRFAALIIPPGDIPAMAAADGVDRLPDLRMRVWPNDPVLRRCLDRLTAPAPVADDADEEDRDEAARWLVLRLTELAGAARPDWVADSTAFDRRTLADLVERIDSRIASPPSAAELARACGLSPSHFAKKFRQSTGASLGRFVQRRRIRAALDRLGRMGGGGGDWGGMAALSIDLGFSSQSHFTRLFADLTGMSPSRFRRQFLRTTG